MMLSLGFCLVLFGFGVTVEVRNVDDDKEDDVFAEIPGDDRKSGSKGPRKPPAYNFKDQQRKYEERQANRKMRRQKRRDQSREEAQDRRRARRLEREREEL